MSKMFSQSFKIRACHFESTSQTGSTQGSAEKWRLRKSASHWTVYEICIKTRGRDAIWSIRGAWDKTAFSAAVRLTERQTDTHTYCKYEFILLYSFWVLSTAVMCIPMPYLLPTFVYKKNIYYHNNEDDDETNDDEYYNYCISIVYVADLYWLFTTVEQNTFRNIQSVYSFYTYCVCKTIRKHLHSNCRVECLCQSIGRSSIWWIWSARWRG